MHTTGEAWNHIIENWNCPHWNPLPEWVKSILQLDSRVGLCNGMIVSKTGSTGMDEFIKRLNGKNHHV